ncbi:TniQ family protein [Chitinibacter tainanensis]|uniref:TniQ family protein n=1 Tax=Chitinibacter tainanensis TaxID=230667 RepID=UPI000428915F|nr:TniQ family protein [Chitinibacter tainanensis]
MPGLLFRPILQPCESVASFFLRASEGNGYKNAREMFLAHRVNYIYSPSFSTARSIDRLVNIFGLFGDFSESILHRVSRSGVDCRRYNEKLIPQLAFREDCSAFCPICIIEKPYWRKLWLLRPYSVCHIHAVLMQLSCYKCSKPLDFNRDRLFYCECGADLTHSPRILEDPKPTQWLYALLEGSEKAKLDGFFKFWMALTQVDDENASAIKELWRLRVTIAWYYSDEVAVDEIRKLVLDQGRHPRVALRSFLCAGNTLKKYACQILGELNGVSFEKDIKDHNYKVGRREASDILGVGRHQLDDLVSEGVLKMVEYGGAYLCFELNGLEELLFNFQNKSIGDELPSLTPSRVSLVERLKLLLSGKAYSLGYDLKTGLQSLAIKVKSSKLEPNNEIVMSFHDVALLLDVHIEVVRSLLHKGWIDHGFLDGEKPKKIMLNTASVELFNQNYQSAGSLARSIGINPTNCAEKLVHLGALPIAGPCVDGVLVYFFRKSDLERIDCSLIKDLKEYKTKAGRPRKNSVFQPASGVSLTTSARLLGVSNQAVASLIHKGVLRKENSSCRDVLVTERSLSALAEIIFSPTYIKVAEAAELLGYTLDQFEVYFIETGMVKVINLHVWRLIHEHDLLYPKKLAADYFSASQAGMLFGMHRSFFPNLESRLGIKPLYVGEGKRRVKFYSKEDVALVAREYRLIPISSRTKFN